MSTVTTTKADLLRGIATEQDWWRAVLDLAAQNGPATGQEEIDGNWTLQELVAHVAGWRSWTLARLEAAAENSSTPTAPWPEELSEATEAGVDEINAWFDAQSRNESFASTSARLFDQLDALRRVVQRMPDADLLTPGRYAAIDPQLAELPIGPALIGYSIAHVHQEHAPALVDWLTVQLGQHPDLPPTPSNFGFDD